MNTMSREEVVEYIEQLAEAEGKELSGNWDSNGYCGEEELTELSGISLEDQEGGEGEGDYYHVVLKIERYGYDDTYIKYVGHYDSWNGTEWYDTFNVVRPKEITVTVYE